jgi:hypothetical protein
MRDTSPPSPPPGWLTQEQATKAVSGELGDAYRRVLSTSCAPICWFSSLGVPDLANMHNGTVTIVQTPKRLMGITAAHVVLELQADLRSGPQTILLMNAQIPELKVIDLDEKLDLATFEIDDAVIKRMGKGITPLTVWPPQPPMEGRGILMGGYPRIVRVTHSPTPAIGAIEWGLFTVIGVAGPVSDEQISWRIARENNIKHPTIPDPPPNVDLGGISGGPVIGLFGTGFHYWALAGIVSQASAQLEKVVAKRADYIREDGKIDRSFI